jgi:hypothetical protein
MSIFRRDHLERSVEQLYRVSCPVIIILLWQIDARGADASPKTGSPGILRIVVKQTDGSDISAWLSRAAQVRKMLGINLGGMGRPQGEVGSLKGV